MHATNAAFPFSNIAKERIMQFQQPGGVSSEACFAQDN